MNQWMDLAERVLDGAEVTDQEALILNCPDEDLLLLMHAAFHIRKRFYGKSKAEYDYECKISMCPENCGYCSQSSISKAPIESYRMVDKHILLKGQNAPTT